MKEIVTKTWCDLHAHGPDELLGEAAGQRVPAECTRVIVLDGGKPIELDLCTGCNLKVFSAIESLLGSGRRGMAPVKSAKPARTEPDELPEWSCKLCEAVYSGKASLVLHVWRDHAHKDKPPQPTRCPDCGVQFEQAYGMGRHRTFKHGYDNLAEAYAAVPRGRRRA